MTVARVVTPALPRVLPDRRLADSAGPYQCGKPVDPEAMIAAGRDANPVARSRTPSSEPPVGVIEAETDLTRVADSIAGSMNNVRNNINTIVGQHTAH
jgi:hypothetical protein